jgi:hemerythrin-like domain-containing protein
VSDYFTALRAIFFCVDEVHETQHHPKESEWLFPKVAAALQEAADAVRQLQYLLLAWEMIGSTRRETFESECRAYVAHLVEHMALEERLVFPLAERSLSAEDWQQLDDAFARCGATCVSNDLADPDCSNLRTRIGLRVDAPSAP